MKPLGPIASLWLMGFWIQGVGPGMLLQTSMEPKSVNATLLRVALVLVGSLIMTIAGIGQISRSREISK